MTVDENMVEIYSKVSRDDWGTTRFRAIDLRALDSWSTDELENRLPLGSCLAYTGLSGNYEDVTRTCIIVAYADRKSAISGRTNQGAYQVMWDGGISFRNPLVEERYKQWLEIRDKKAIEDGKEPSNLTTYKVHASRVGSSSKGWDIKIVATPQDITGHTTTVSAEALSCVEDEPEPEEDEDADDDAKCTRCGTIDALDAIEEQIASQTAVQEQIASTLTSLIGVLEERLTAQTNLFEGLFTSLRASFIAENDSSSTTDPFEDEFDGALETIDYPDSDSNEEAKPEVAVKATGARQEKFNLGNGYEDKVKADPDLI
jgi:hypothetical protein